MRLMGRDVLSYSDCHDCQSILFCMTMHYIVFRIMYGIMYGDIFGLGQPEICNMDTWKGIDKKI
jgi:hypothetical protein